MDYMQEDTVLDSGSIKFANTLFGLSEDRLNDLLAIAGVFRENEQAMALAGRFHALFYHSDTGTQEAGERWGQEGAILGNLQAGMGALLILSGAAHIDSFYRARNIPRGILADSLKDLSIWMDDHHANTGRTGLVEVSWLLHSVRGELFRLGRLQFMHQKLDWNITAATRRADGLPILFFPESVCLREDGQVDGTNGIYASSPFRSEFSANDEFICGTPVHPGGFVLQQKVRLKRGEWEITVQPGAGSIDIHIPKDGKMELEQCRQSLLSAVGFFPTHFPEKPFDVFTLCTWFLDAQLQQILPVQSNIIRFQREFYLFPVLSHERFTYERVFGNPVIDIETAPEDTALRRAIKAFVLAGGKIRFNAGIIMPQDLHLFGNVTYQTYCADSLLSAAGTDK